MLALRYGLDDDRLSRMPLTALELRVIGRKLDERWAAVRRSARSEVAGPQTLIREFASVDAARHRLRDGSYGSCVRCDRPIGIARLLADPAAARCSRCEAARA